MKLPKLTKEVAEQIDAEYQEFLKQESLKESEEIRTIDTEESSDKIKEKLC